MARVLLVEDDPTLSSRLVQWLERERFEVQHTASGDEALGLLKTYSFDLIILDWILSGISGVEVCRSYRACGGRSSVLMLTRKSDIQDKEEGLDAGADDYLPKPFHPREFSARVRALLRRQPGYAAEILKVGDLVLDKAAHKVTLKGESIKLFPQEFALLEFFMKHPNQIFSNQALLERVWPIDSDATTDAVRTCLKSLRKKIDKTGDKNIDGEIPGNSHKESQYIQNIHGVGYLFKSLD